MDQNSKTPTSIFFIYSESVRYNRNCDYGRTRKDFVLKLVHQRDGFLRMTKKLCGMFPKM